MQKLLRKRMIQKELKINIWIKQGWDIQYVQYQELRTIYNKDVKVAA